MNPSENTELDDVEVPSHFESESESEESSNYPQSFLIQFKHRLRDSVVQRFGTTHNAGQGKGRKIVTSDVLNDKFYIISTLLDPKMKTLPFEGSKQATAIHFDFNNRDCFLMLIKFQKVL